MFRAGVGQQWIKVENREIQWWVSFLGRKFSSFFLALWKSVFFPESYKLTGDQGERERKKKNQDPKTTPDSLYNLAPIFSALTVTFQTKVWEFGGSTLNAKSRKAIDHQARGAGPGAPRLHMPLALHHQQTSSPLLAAHMFCFKIKLFQLQIIKQRKAKKQRQARSTWSTLSFPSPTSLRGGHYKPPQLTLFWNPEATLQGTTKPIQVSSLLLWNRNETRSEASSHVAIYANRQTNVCPPAFWCFKMNGNFANIYRMLSMNQVPC